jgi:acyl carrier protein
LRLSRSEASSFIVQFISKRLGVEQSTIEPGERFRSIGLDSLGSTTMLAELSKVAGFHLAATLAWEYPTPAALAGYVVSGRTQQAAAPLSKYP